ncbi:MAG TPA: hypothetical protein DCS66_07920 [Flavobacteriaceae bacterium]|nr:hypothetical protein [Flavobacteriaceae bacterium]HAT64516.1 hypothetical protein [Flavobacteriaceae bacterium]|tara:strand:+ start:1538 stop:1948 length:411 start_codon:yes stop_codon:yes gene_type:complete
MDNKIQFEKATLWYSEGILYCKLFNQDINYNLTEENTLNYINAMISLCNGVCSPFLIDLRDVKGTYTIDAAKLLSNTKAIKELRLCEAFLLNSMSSKLLVDSYKRIYDPKTPFKIFYEMDRAIKYCNEMNIKYGSN